PLPIHFDAVACGRFVSLNLCKKEIIAKFWQTKESIPEDSDLLAGTPDAEVSAAMHQAHEVEHAVVVALHTVGDLGIPEGFDEGFFRRAGSGGEAAYGGGRGHAGGVAVRVGLAFERVAVYEGIDALGREKFLDAVA